jgi:membrane glycosyltransferase
MALTKFTDSSALGKSEALLAETRRAAMPPLVRGSMVPMPWAGFWSGLRTGLSTADSRIAASPDAARAAAWRKAVAARRHVLVLFTLLIAGGAATLLARAWPDYEYPAVRVVEITLFSLLFAWISVGSLTAFMGFYARLRGDRWAMSLEGAGEGAIDAQARTAIVMPICNEHVPTVFAGLRATVESLAANDQAALFDVFVLSDSGSLEVRAAEQAAYVALCEELRGRVRLYYRARQVRQRRKAGNIADFCRRWGRAYRYMIILDADSVMTGACMASLVRLMERHPNAGIIQTTPKTCGLQSAHARLQQFAGRVTGRLFTIGMQFWQLGDSHYWGHNAIIRVEAFMRHAALASLPEKDGSRSHVLSHDFVEAALMGRAGYETWLVPDLEGSYEQQPANLIEELQRDRRWCEGNLLNARLITEPGLRAVHRAMLGTGAMAYLSAPLWLAYLIVGTVAAWLTPEPEWLPYDIHGPAHVPVAMICLWISTAALLLLPRVLGVVLVVMNGEQKQYGGTARLIFSAVLEAGLSVLQAPVRMMAHSTFVLSALTGLSLEWKSPSREARSVDWSAAMHSFGHLAVIAGLLCAGLLILRPDAAIWVMPVVVPLLLAVPVTVLSSQVWLGRWARANGVLMVPEEAAPPRVLRQAWIYVRRASMTLVPAAEEGGQPDAASLEEPGAQALS